MTTDAISRLLVQALIGDGVLPGAAEHYHVLAGERGEGLVSAGLLAESERLKVLARLLHLEFVELDEDFVPDIELIRTLSPERIKAWQVLPLSANEREVRMACAYPFDSALEDKLHALTGKSIRLALCDAQALRRILAQAQLDRHILEHNSDRLRNGGDSAEAEDGHTHDLEAPARDPVVTLVNQLCREAIRREASDVHLESRRSGLVGRFRVDGVLVPAGVDVSGAHATQMTSRLKVMASLDIAEHQLPQDGRLRLMHGGVATDVRVSVMPTAHGEDVVLRFLDRNVIARDDQPEGLGALGLEESVLSTLRRALREPAGMVLVAGPTGSGKTTTLYSALTELQTGMEKIITIEDPVEYQLPGVVQIPVNERRGLTFARGLRSVLRHDPDCILVGEIRDLDTANIAVQAAMTGHLVFSTVHANEPLDVVARLRHMGVDHYNLLASVKCVLSQRLVRSLCRECAESRPLSPVEHETFVEAGIEPPVEIQHPKGCRECNETGYRGRMAIAEAVWLSPVLRNLLLEHATPAALQDELDRQGRVPLRKSALLKVVAGTTSLAEADRVTGRRYP